MRKIRLRFAALAFLFATMPALAQAQCDAWFPFDGNLSDASGNGYDGTMIGKGGVPALAQFSTGVVGQALQVDGRSAMRAYIDLNPDACPQVTITAWIRVESNDVNSSQFLISTGAGNGPGLRSSGTIAVLTGNGNGLMQRDALRDGRAWFFFAGVYDYAANTYRFHWRDRIVEGQLAESRRPPDDALWVGAFNDQLHHAFKNAYVDELRITGRTLTPGELARMRGGRPGAIVMLDGDADTDTEFASGTSTGNGIPQAVPGVSLGMNVPRIDVNDLPERPTDLLNSTAGDGGPLMEVPAGFEAARSGTTEPNLTPLNEDSVRELDTDFGMPPGVTAPGEPASMGNVVVDPRLYDYRIAQVNSTIAPTHIKYGMDLPLAVRVHVDNIPDEGKVVFYAAIGQPGSAEPLVIADRYESMGSGPHIVTLSVPLKSPLVSGNEFRADLFLLAEKKMPGLPGQTVTIKSPIDDADPDNNRENLVYEVHRPKGYVLTHEHPTYGMAFGGNFAFAGAAGNFRHGIMENGYTAHCSGCIAPHGVGSCDHGEVKGGLLQFLGALGRDMRDHLPEMGPFHNSNSHLRYSTQWIRDAHNPRESDFEDARMRIMIAFAVENEAMCEQLYYANKGLGGPGGDGYACSKGDSFASLKRQLDNLKAWAAENSSWMEIAYNAGDARRIVDADKLAIILGVESEYSFGAENRAFDPVDRLNKYYDEGVRTFYLAHKINSRLAGADIYFPNDSDPGKAIRVTQALSGCFYVDDNLAHFPLEGRLGKKLCDNNCGANAYKGGKVADACAYKLSDISEANMVDYVLTRGKEQFNGFRLYPTVPGFRETGGSRMDGGFERNNLGLSHDGERVVREAMLKGMILNIDHVSSRARDKMNELATEVFDNYPLNALHNKPNDMLTDTKKFWKHEYDLDRDELHYVRDTGGFFGFRMGPTDSVEFPAADISPDCKNTSTESAKMLAWLLDEGLSVGYALDFATTTQGVHSRTFAKCGESRGPDMIHTYVVPGTGVPQVTEGISHVGMMKQWHAELKAIGLKQDYIDKLRDDGVDAFLQMWEKSESASGTGAQISRNVVVIPTPHQ